MCQHLCIAMERLLMLVLVALFHTKIEATPVQSSIPFLRIDSVPPSSVRVQKGESFHLTCGAFGRPPPMIQWLLDGKALCEDCGAQNENTRVEVEKNKGLKTIDTGDTKSHLTINCADEATVGVYTCLASNTVDGETFHQAVSTRVELAEEDSTDSIQCKSERKFRVEEVPKIVTWTDFRMERDDAAAQLVCRASGIPQPKITWYSLVAAGRRERVELGDNFQQLPNGDLLVKNQQPVTRGGHVFICVASNVYGEDSKTVTLLLVEYD